MENGDAIIQDTSTEYAKENMYTVDMGDVLLRGNNIPLVFILCLVVFVVVLVSRTYRKDVYNAWICVMFLMHLVEACYAWVFATDNNGNETVNNPDVVLWTALVLFLLSLYDTVYCITRRIPLSYRFRQGWAFIEKCTKVLSAAMCVWVEGRMFYHLFKYGNCSAIDMTAGGLKLSHLYFAYWLYQGVLCHIIGEIVLKDSDCMPDKGAFFRIMYWFFVMHYHKSGVVIYSLAFAAVGLPRLMKEGESYAHCVLLTTAGEIYFLFIYRNMCTADAFPGVSAVYLFLYFFVLVVVYDALMVKLHWSTPLSLRATRRAIQRETLVVVLEQHESSRQQRQQQQRRDDLLHGRNLDTQSLGDEQLHNLESELRSSLKRVIAFRDSRQSPEQKKRRGRSRSRSRGRSRSRSRGRCRSRSRRKNREIAPESAAKRMYHSIVQKACQFRRSRDNEKYLQEKLLCLVCCTNRINSLLSPCGHVCVCDQCVSQLDACPICRSVITDNLAAYL